jgi:hypothetical protein
MVVPPVLFDMVCAGCAWREGKAKVVKVTTFAQNCCARDNPCRFIWQGLPLPNAIDPIFTDLEMYSPPGNTHGNPPAAAAADDKEDATADDEEKPAAVDKAAAAAAATATVNDEAELQLGVLPWRPYPLLNPVLFNAPPTVPFAAPAYTGNDLTFPPFDGNRPLTTDMVREAVSIADEATVAAALETMRQVDLPIVGKKKINRPIAAFINRPIAAFAPPALPPTCHSTRTTKKECLA